MSFEEQQLEKASNELDTTIRLCSNTNKVLSSFKKAFSLRYLYCLILLLRLSFFSFSKPSQTSLLHQKVNNLFLINKLNKNIILVCY
jgi:hypothetical protein